MTDCIRWLNGWWLQSKGGGTDYWLTWWPSLTRSLDRKTPMNLVPPIIRMFLEFAAAETCILAPLGCHDLLFCQIKFHADWFSMKLSIPSSAGSLLLLLVVLQCQAVCRCWSEMKQMEGMLPVLAVTCAKMETAAPLKSEMGDGRRRLLFRDAVAAMPLDQMTTRNEVLGLGWFWHVWRGATALSFVGCSPLVFRSLICPRRSIPSNWKGRQRLLCHLSLNQWTCHVRYTLSIKTQFITEMNKKKNQNPIIIILTKS